MSYDYEDVIEIDEIETKKYHMSDEELIALTQENTNMLNRYKYRLFEKGIKVIDDYFNEDVKINNKISLLSKNERDYIQMVCLTYKEAEIMGKLEKLTNG